MFNSRQKYLIEEAASHLRSIAYAAQNGDDAKVKMLLTHLAESRLVLDTKPQEWDAIYDVAHRS